MKHRLLSLLFACCIAAAGFSAVNYSLNESFESGIPASWSQEVVNTSAGGAWILDNLSSNPTGAYEGAKRVALRSPEGNSGFCVRLVTPVLDLSSVFNPQLSFAYAQPKKAGMTSDTLTLYYRVSSTSQWVQFARYEPYQNTWSHQTLDLPAACKVSTCQLAFEGKENGGHGVILDLVRVFPESQCADAVLSETTVGANAARVNWASQAGRQFELLVSATAIPVAQLDTCDKSSAVFYSNSITGTGQTITGLSSGTKYYIYVRTDCDDNESGHTNWVSGDFTTALGVPYSDALAAVPSTWKRYSGAAANVVNGTDLTSETSSYSGWRATTYTTVLGAAHLYANPSSTPNWLATPDIDLSGVQADKSVLLSFKLAFTSSISATTASSNMASSKLHVYVSSDKGETWTLKHTIKGSEMSNTGRTYNVLLDEFKDESIRLAIVAEGSSSSAYFHLANFSVAESDGSCLGLTGLTAIPSTTSISLSWTVIGSSNNAIALLYSDANRTNRIDSVYVNAPSASFDGLTAGTTYYVSVRQDCENADVLTASVTTAFAIPFVENFNSLTSGIPAGWDNSEGTASTPWTYYSTGHEGKCVRFDSYNNSSNTTSILAMPPLVLTQDADLNFWWKNPTGGAGEVLISTDGGANKTSLLNDLTDISSWTKYTVDLSAYTGQTVIIYFKGTSNWGSGDAYLYLDDVEVIAQPDCKVVQGLAVDNITGSAATVSFTQNGAAEYDVLVTTKAVANPDTLSSASLIAFRDTVTTNAAVVSGLAPALTYYAYVRALCGGEERGEWSAVKSFDTECEIIVVAKNSQWIQDFENITIVGSGASSAVAAPPCYASLNATSGPYAFVSGDASSSYSFINSGSKYLFFNGSSGSSSQLAHFILPTFDAPNTLRIRLDYAIEGSSSGDFVIGYMTDITKQDSFVAIATLPRPSSNKTAVTSDWIALDVIPDSVVANARIAIRYTGTSYWYANIDNIIISKIPSCQSLGAIELASATPNSATLRFAATNASQYQVVLATQSINPDSLESSTAVVYNQLVSTTQPAISGLEGNTRYYAYVRGYCGGEDYSEWAAELSFKTLCNAISVADFGLETFNAPASADCWTFGFNTKGTSSASAYAKRDSVKAYGAYIKLSKESVAYTKNAQGVDTVYNDGAYAITPELDIEDIRAYQVSFSAATTSQVSTNYKRLNIGVLADPNDMSAVEVLKTIDLDYAADSTSLKSYSVSFANAPEDYLGRPIKYVIFQLYEAAHHDSTNFALIDNVQIELASTCEQLMETKADSVGVYGASISWENSGAAEYQVMVATVNTLRPDTISAPVSINKVSTTKAVLTGLESNTQYYAYVRGICGASDTAKWSNAVSFRTSIAVPYLEPFSATTLNEGWQSKYLYASSLPDSIAPDAFSDPTSSYAMWGMTNLSLPSGMSGYAAAVAPTSNYAYAWLLSPVIDMTENADDFIALSFKMAGNNVYSYGYVGLYISVDGGKYVPLATWKSSGATNPISEIKSTDSTYVFNLSKYAGKRISLAWGTYQSYTSGRNLFIDDVDIHTTSAVCRGIESVSVAPAAESAKVSWEIEGTPVKAAVMISDSANFATYIDSVDVEDVLEHTFSGLNPNTTYFVRVKQLDCENAEWKSVSFTTECLPIATLPWNEDFESYTSYTSSYSALAFAPNCWTNEHISGSGSYLFYVYGSTNGTNSTKQLCLPDMSAGTKTLLTLPTFAIDEADAYQFILDVYRNASSYPMEGLRIYASLTGVLDTTATELAFISRNYTVKDTTGVNIIPAEKASDWYTYVLNIPLQGDVRIFIQGESQYGSSTYMDNFVVRHIPGCPDMSGLAVDSIVSDSARLYVDDLGAAGYHFVVATAQIGVDTLAKVDAAKIVLNDSVMGDTAMFVEGLKQGTYYYVYARAICNEGKHGAWSTPVSFASACVIYNIVEGAPFTQNFNAVPSGAPACWTNDLGNATYPWEVYAAGEDGSMCMIFDSYSNYSGEKDTLVTPAMYLASDAILSFSWKNPAGGAANVLISGDNGATKTSLKSNLTGISSWTEYKIELAAYTGQTVNIYFAGTSNYGYDDAYLYLDNVKVSAISSCLSATGLVVDSIALDSARIRFDKSDDATYDIVVASAQLDMYNLSAADSAKIAFSADAYADTVLFATGLKSSTLYYAYVRVNCGSSSSSDWTNPVAFCTECETVVVTKDAPWSEDFAGLAGTFNKACWEMTRNAGEKDFQVTTSAVGDNSSEKLYVGYQNVGSEYGGTTNTVDLRTPAFQSDAANAYTFSLDMYRASDSYGDIEGVRIMASLSPVLDNSAVELGYICRIYNKTTTGSVDAESAAGWYTYEFTIPLEGEVYIFVRAEQEYDANNIIMDNFQVSKLPDCKPVKGLAVEEITKNSAQLTFATNGALEYEILATTKAIDPDTIARVATSLIAFRDTIQGDTIAVDTVAITELTPATPYFAYMRALCGGEERGAWSNEVLFSTECEAIAVTVANPWVEDFESYTGGTSYSESYALNADCWKNEHTVVVNGYYNYTNYRYYVYTSANGGNSTQKLCLPDMSAGNITLLTLPSFAIDEAEAYQFALDVYRNASSYATEGLRIYASVSGKLDSTATELAFISRNYTVADTTEFNIIPAESASDWYTYELSIPLQGDVHIFVQGESQYGSATYMDNFKVSKLPACRDIKSVAVSNITTTSAQVIFKKSNADDFDFIITTAAIKPDTIALVADSIIFRHDTIAVDTIVVSGFEPSTDYYVYLRGLCSETERSAWASAQFSTQCLVAVPYAEDFDGDDVKPAYTGSTSAAIPACWTGGYKSTSYVASISTNTSYSSYAFSGTSALRLYSTSGYMSYIALPEIDASLDTLQLTFKARAMYQGSSSVSNYATSTYAHSVKIGTLTDPNDYATFKLLDTYVLKEYASTPASADTCWEDVTVYLQGATGKYIALVSDFDKTNYVWIDDVQISRAPDCVAPSGLSAVATPRSADLAWTSTATAFEVAFGRAGYALPDSADYIYSVLDTTGLHLDSLESSTMYEFYIRTVCDENLYSPWSKVASFTTGCPVPFADDFEGSNQWTFINGTSTNAWAWGTATSKEGTHAMYISNDAGVSNDYSHSTTIVFATKTFSFEEDGHYVFQYDWKANGESDYDYLRVALVPAETALSAGTTPTGFGYSALPSGWKALDGGSQLCLSSDWQTQKSAEIELAAGNHMVVFAWKNDGSGGTTPPAAIDNFSIRQISCPAPNAPIVKAITTTTAVIQLDTVAPAYQVALVHGLDTLKQMVVANDTLLLENLAPATSYLVLQRAFCSESDSSDWSAPAAFVTECLPVATLPWSENFDGITGSTSEHVLPVCWNYINTCSYESSYSNYKIYPTAYESESSANSAPNYLRFYSYYSSWTDYDPQDQYAILPEMADFSSARMKLAARAYSTSYDATFTVGVMTDPSDASSFVAVGTYTPASTTYEEFIIPLYNYTGEGKYIAIKMAAANASASTRGLYIDDIVVEEIDLSCLGVENLKVSDISESGVRLDFRYIDGLEHDANVAISKEAAFDESTAILMDTVLADSTYYFNVTLESETTYYLYVRQYCGEDSHSEWKMISFKTPYTIRYEAEFESTSMPEEWSLYSGMMNAVIAGTSQLTAASSGWTVVSGTNAISANHLKMNIYGNRNYWVVSPLVSLDAPAGSDVQLRFDAAYNKWNELDTDPTVGADDRFAVLVSADNGDTWSKLAEWNNAGTGNYVLSQIPKEGKTYFVDLKDYVGQSVKVAFYGESTVDNADNDLHVGNIVINRSVEEAYSDTICAGSDYDGSEHGNAFVVTSDEYKEGLNTFEKYIAAENGSNMPDSLLTLKLTVMPINHYEDSTVICEGEHYSQMHFGKLIEFDATLGMGDVIRYTTSEYGCDEVITIHVTVLPKVEEHIYDSVAQGDSYEWHGESYISAGVYEYVTKSLVTGCDSTVYLHLSVYQKEEAIPSVQAQSLLIAPNPVKAGEPIQVLTSFTADELANAHIEIVSATSALVYVQHGADEPFILPGLPISGVYVVRIRIDDAIYISSLLVK